MNIFGSVRVAVNPSFAGLNFLRAETTVGFYREKPNPGQTLAYSCFVAYAGTRCECGRSVLMSASCILPTSRSTATRDSPAVSTYV